MMEDHETGCFIGSNDQKAGWGEIEFSWILLLFFVALFGGDEVKLAVTETAISKLKEVRSDGEQLIRNYEELSRLTADGDE